MRLCASVIALAILSPLSAFAQDAPPPAPPPGAPPAAVETPPPPPPAAPAPTPVVAAPAAAPAKTWKDTVTLEGLVDSYYMYNLSGATSLQSPTGRQFDVNSNTFTLNYAKIGLGMSSDNVGLRIDLGYGATGFIVNNAVPPTPPAMGGAPSTAFLVQQAYATLTPVENLTIDFGKFVTTAGAEVIESNKNWLYSRSILFFNIPLLHTGLRIGYKVNDMISAQVSLVNGWNGNGIDPDVNKDKTFGASVTVTVPGGVVVIPTLYVGNEGSGDTRITGDLVASYTAGPLGLNLNFDYVKDTAAGVDPFLGVAVMGHYVISDQINGTLRGEYAQVKSGGTTTKFEEVTVGVAVPMAGHWEFRPEFRFDNSDTAFTANMKKNQATLTGAFLAYF